MTDHELLERAARAAGYADLTEWSDKITDHDSPHYGMPALHPSGFGQHAASWNPLVDDGDAFRLMVACRLLLQVSDDDGCTRALDEFGDTILREMHVNDDNENAATRRAIVRAAAEMGENK